VAAENSWETTKRITRVCASPTHLLYTPPIDPNTIHPFQLRSTRSSSPLLAPPVLAPKNEARAHRTGVFSARESNPALSRCFSDVRRLSRILRGDYTNRYTSEDDVFDGEQDVEGLDGSTR
jgi:hypothetical protein